MDISRAINEYVIKGTELFYRLRSEEADSVSDTELVMLRTQMQVIDVEAARVQNRRRFEAKAKAEPAVSEETGKKG
jgi:hypothetical protein